VDLDQLLATYRNCLQWALGQPAAELAAFLSPSQTQHQLSHLLMSPSEVKNQNHKQCSVISAANPPLPSPTAAFTTGKHTYIAHLF